jgi:hypothetical protein
MNRTLFPILASLLAATILAADVSPGSSVVQTPVADASGSVVPAETAAAREARLAWWREARFGMFIHFGLYAIPGRGECEISVPAPNRNDTDTIIELQLDQSASAIAPLAAVALGDSGGLYDR